jgi:hypothetical protein
MSVKYYYKKQYGKHYVGGDNLNTTFEQMTQDQLALLYAFEHPYVTKNNEVDAPKNEAKRGRSKDSDGQSAD